MSNKKFSLLFLSISKKERISIKKHSLKSFKRIANDRNPVIGRSIAGPLCRPSPTDYTNLNSNEIVIHKTFSFKIILS